MDIRIAILALIAAIPAGLHAGDAQIAADAVNALGVDLYRAHTSGEANLLLSPYSIQSALAMTYAGADGETHTEMQRVLHFPDDEASLHDSFHELADQLAAIVARSQAMARTAPATSRPIEFHLANRLYVQRGQEFQPPFLALLKDRYAASPEEVDYRSNPEAARLAINRWVQAQTQDRIRDLLGVGPMPANTRLMLINALYLRAPWPERAVRNERFLAHGRDGVNVPTMVHQAECGYVAGGGLQIIACSYEEMGLQFVVAFSDQPGGLASLERALTPKLLGEWAHLKTRPVILHLPKFRLAPATLPLREDLEALGMKTAFDNPPGSANFTRIAPRKGDDYLGLTAVLHKTYLVVDEKGTEAAAATSVHAGSLAAPVPEVKMVPIEVRVDRPFLFAIQHVPSGACLFLGRVTDPR